MPRFRISDGRSCAVEFEASAPSEFASAGVDAVIDVRRRTCKRYHAGEDRTWRWFFPPLEIHVYDGHNWVWPQHKPHLLTGVERENLEAAGVAATALPQRLIVSPTRRIGDGRPLRPTTTDAGDAAILRAVAVSVYGAALCSLEWAVQLDAFCRAAITAAFGGGE